MLEKSLHHWINDGLMAVFFFVVGLEIKRELLVGELSSGGRRRCPPSPPWAAWSCPPLLYVAVNAGATRGAGWGIPMATDIAFALGMLAAAGQPRPRWR